MSNSARLENSENDQMSSEYLEEIYQNMLNEEKNLPNFFGYMKKQPEINEKKRAMLIDWLIDVHFKFKLKPETLFLAVWLIDRYLSEKIIKVSKLQLLGVTCMLISCKYEEIYSPEIFDFVYITENTYEKKDIIKLETEILKLIGFSLTVPTSNLFLSLLSPLVHLSQREYLLASYLLELSLLDYRCLRHRPSILAASAVALVVLHRRRNHTFEEPVASFIDEEKIRAPAGDLAFLIENIDRSQLLAVKKKFLTKKCKQVARVKKIFNIKK